MRMPAHTPDYTIDIIDPPPILSKAYMDMSLAQKAINLALNGSWEEAKTVNLEILASDPNDVDSLNRLARSHAELGEIDAAKKIAKKVLTIDPVNTIAQKCLEKWGALNHAEKNPGVIVSSEAFLEESGKTKLVTLLFPGDEKILVNLDPGEEVDLTCSAHRVNIVTKDNKYIGRLPDDLAARIKNLIKSGNKYQVLIKSIKPRDINVFIREIEKSAKSKGVTSFPSEKIEYVSFTPPELIHDDVPIDLNEELETPSEF